MPFLQSRISPPSRCQVLRRKCCDQMKQVEPHYRQQAIYDMVLSIMEQQPHQQGDQQGHTMTMVEAAQMAQQLPAMCGLQQPSYGTFPFGMAGGGSYQPSYGTSPFGGLYQPSYGASSPFGMAAGGMYQQPGYGTSPFDMAGAGMFQPSYGASTYGMAGAGGGLFGMAGCRRWYVRHGRWWSIRTELRHARRSVRHGRSC
ncbi:hypothetical protein PR202_gb22540 [Eleusine coracana subsp. coracana]|uniref:Bifunctional inhibitor/plant lipid transfer protein/seed storage helical domain-containing protein n=1 Tax=Eleusine coracana subsp. coracana TaxID=191504 RepID=A0AAV5FHJ3_ELECO|nr:hypothetical protein PR202_gb22540 [Eleusine coracana subsp. coracana]